MEELLTQIIQAIVDKPDEVDVKVIDTENNKIYEYDEEGNQITIPIACYAARVHDRETESELPYLFFY